MPILQITTNLEKRQVPSKFLVKASAKIAELTGRPEFTIQIVVLTDQLLSLAGSQQGPIAYVTLSDINPPMDSRAETAKSLHDFLVKELGLESDRFFISFTSLTSDDVSRSGKLVTQLIKELEAQGHSFARK